MELPSTPKLLKSAALFLSACALAAVGARAQAPDASRAADAAVVMERGNPQRTGLYPAGPQAPAGVRAWESAKLFQKKRGHTNWGRTITVRDNSGTFTFFGPDFYWPAPGPRYSDPAVAGGMVYFTAFVNDGYLYALDARTGQLAWGAKADGGTFSSPLVSGETLYVGASGGLFFAFDLKSRQEKWRHNRTDTSYVSHSPVLVGGVVYYGATNGILYALDAATGQPKWQFRTQSRYQSPPAADGRAVYVASDGILYALDARTGAERWKLQTTEGALSPVVADGLVYFGDYKGHIRAADAANGRLQAKPAQDHQSGTAIAVSGRTIYFGGWDSGSLFAVDSVTREKKWKFSLSSEANCEAPITDGRGVYFTCDDGRLYAVDAETGKKLWTASAKSGPLSAPVIADGTLYFISDEGKAYAVK